MQLVLTYILMVGIQNNSIGLINTQLCCNYARVQAGHFVKAPVFQLSFSGRSERCLFTSAMSVHRTVSDTFPNSPLQNKSTVSLLVNRFRSLETFRFITSDLRKIGN
jgi:hypothetical protein